MRRALIRLSFTEEYTPEHCAAIRAAVRPAFGTKPGSFTFKGERISDSNEKVEQYNYGEAIVDLDAVPWDAPFEIVERERPHGPLALDPRPEAVQLNTRVHVAVPDLGLLLIEEVGVRTDYCTEALNEELRKGWKILAICPQPDQRRPDYVLGRAKKAEE